MPEITTCEQYVVAELLSKEDELLDLKEKLRVLELEKNKSEEKLKLIETLIKENSQYNHFEDKIDYISFNTLSEVDNYFNLFYDIINN